MKETSSRRTTRRLCSNPRRKVIQVPGLDINRTWASEPAHKAFTRLYTRESPTSSALDLVIAVPGHEMTVVHDVFFVWSQLTAC